jgi:DNA repair photolyase
MNKRVFGTKEWADLSANCSDGCENDCKYCYAKEMAIRFGRRTPENWKEVRPTFKKMSKAIRHSPARVMFPTTHDILESNINECVRAIGKLLDAGHDILIVSKPRINCIIRICDEFKNFRERILFRFTIGSACDTVLSHWEPGAPRFEERIKCLKYAFDRNFNTSVSCEPMLDDNIGAVVTAAEPFVTDAIWLGKMNKASARLTMNGGTVEDIDILRILIDTQSDDRIIKLYELYKDHPKIKWKESIKSVVGIDIPTEPGLDI